MNIQKIHAANLAVFSVLALAARTASAEIPIDHPNFAPGPEHEPVTPHYYDEHHTDHDYNYWQSMHDAALKEKEARDHDLAIRRAEADRFEREQAAAQQQQGMQPAR